MLDSSRDEVRRSYPGCRLGLRRSMLRSLKLKPNSITPKIMAYAAISHIKPSAPAPGNK
jgi:hypothetical protein